MKTIQQMRELRASLPQGKKDPWGECCPSKRILLGRALKKNDLRELTAGEFAVVQEWLEFTRKMKRETEIAVSQVEKTIAKLTQS